MQRQNIDRMLETRYMYCDFYLNIAFGKNSELSHFYDIGTCDSDDATNMNDYKCGIIILLFSVDSSFLLQLSTITRNRKHIISALDKVDVE